MKCMVICVCGVQWSKGENEVMMQSVKGKMESKGNSKGILCGLHGKECKLG